MKMRTISALVSSAILAGMSGIVMAQADNADKSGDFAWVQHMVKSMVRKVMP